ncbi:MAG: hypothetical protein ABIP89_20555, partial [Polyangiaceae bacterium]
MARLSAGQHGDGGGEEVIFPRRALVVGVVLLSFGCLKKKPPPPDETKPVVVVTKPKKEDPPAPVEPDAAEAQRQLWLHTDLNGRDNDVAAYRKVTITTDSAGARKIVIKNQFGLTCALFFDAEGRPGEITGCKGDDGWHSSTPRIKLTCGLSATAETCRGKYTLSDKSGFNDPAVL